MTKAKRLSRKLLSLEDLFKGELKEQQALDKHKVGGQLHRRWLADDRSVEEFKQCVAGAYRQSTFLTAGSAALAAKRLVELTECGKEETVSKACLDIITTNPSMCRTGTSSARDDNAGESTPIPPETASRLLAVLAGEGNNQETSLLLHG